MCGNRLVVVLFVLLEGQCLSEFSRVITITPSISEDVDGLIERYRADEVQSRLRRDKESLNDDPARWLELQDLPALRRSLPGFLEVCRRSWAEILLLVLTNGLLAGAVWRRCAGYSLT